MFHKTALMAIAATAALGVAMLTSITAHAGPGPGKVQILKPGIVGQLKPIGVKPIKPIKPKWPPIVVKPKWPKPIHVVHVHRRVIYAAPAVYAVARPAVAGPCTCLSKEYTQEGAVLFKDRCTNEMAMNPPAQPQQVGMVEQPSQTAYVQQPQAQAAQQ